MADRSRRGRIALIQSGAQRIVGACDIVGVRGPLTLDDLRDNLDRHCSVGITQRLPYPKTYAWVLENAVRFDEPIPFTSAPGAVIWARLPARIAEEVDRRTRAAAGG